MTDPAQGTAIKRKRGRPRKDAQDAGVPKAPAPLAGHTTVPSAAPSAPSVSPPSSSLSGDPEADGLDGSEDGSENSDAWETESLFLDLLDECNMSGTAALDADVCTPVEAMRYRQELHAVGPEEFCQRTVHAGHISAKKLLTAFGVRAPSFLDGEPDEAYLGLLSIAVSRELSKRAKLMRYNTIEDAVELLQTRSNIIVLTGAGISTSLGIPDFRSKDVGLYSRLEHLGLSDPQEVFDIHLFRQDPTIFYSVARDILPSTDRYTPTHRFIAMLQEKGKLLTNYSQNIDNLESMAGITPDKLIQCHGSFATATCIVCGFKAPGATINPTIKQGRIPRCPRCTEAMSSKFKRRKANATSNITGNSSGNSSGNSTDSRSSSMDKSTNADGTARRPRGRPPKQGRPRGRPRKQQKRSDDDSDGDAADGVFAGGVMKPDITFFGEQLPDAFRDRVVDHDRDKVDLVVVIGTSLKVAPVSEMVPFLPPGVPQIYISREPVSHINFDIDLLGDCDVVVAELCRRAGWDLAHEMVPADQQIAVEMGADGVPSRHRFTDVTPGRVAAGPTSTAAIGSAVVKDEDLKPAAPLTARQKASADAAEAKRAKDAADSERRSSGSSGGKAKRGIRIKAEASDVSDSQ